MSTLTDAAISAPIEGPPAPEIDPVEVAALEIFATRGWTRTDKNGEQVQDDATAKNFVYALFRDSGVVNSDHDIVDDGLSVADLYAKTFPTAPGATSESVDDVQFAAYTRVSRKLWQWAGTNIKAHCQETAEMEGLDFVMCEKKVFRGSRDTSTGSGAPKQIMVRFFTADPDLIFTLSSQPATAKLVKAAETTAKHLHMNATRHPELTARIAKETQSALKRSAAHLAPITAGKSHGALAVDSADDN